jgi:hypothetical protein
MLVGGKTAAALAVLIAEMSQFALAEPQSAPDGSSNRQAAPSAMIAQLPRYSASGVHQCGAGNGGKHSCVVSGLFSDCNQAATSLRTLDCCPTTKGGGASTAFTLSYCIPDYSGR